MRQYTQRGLGNDMISPKDIKEFNSALLKYVTKLQEDYELLQEKVHHLESMLMALDIPKIGEKQ